MFSKFAFKKGKYDNMTVTEAESQQVRNYALKMALDGKRMSCGELFRLFINETAKKD